MSAVMLSKSLLLPAEPLTAETATPEAIEALVDYAIAVITGQRNVAPMPLSAEAQSFLDAEQQMYLGTHESYFIRVRNRLIAEDHFHGQMILSHVCPNGTLVALGRNGYETQQLLDRLPDALIPKVTAEVPWAADILIDRPIEWTDSSIDCLEFEWDDRDLDSTHFPSNE